MRKFKLGSGSKLKRLVKQSEWQIIDRQTIILWVKVSVFYGFRAVNLFVVFLAFFWWTSELRNLNFSGMFVVHPLSAIGVT
jgi:hypothetical protein